MLSSARPNLEQRDPIPTYLYIYLYPCIIIIWIYNPSNFWYTFAKKSMSVITYLIHMPRCINTHITYKLKFQRGLHIRNCYTVLHPNRVIYTYIYIYIHINININIYRYIYIVCNIYVTTYTQISHVLIRIRLTLIINSHRLSILQNQGKG